MPAIDVLRLNHSMTFLTDRMWRPRHHSPLPVAFMASRHLGIVSSLSTPSPRYVPVQVPTSSRRNSALRYAHEEGCRVFTVGFRYRASNVTCFKLCRISHRSER